MSKLVRMDQTGHTTLAEWAADDPASVEAAVQAFREELDQGYFAMVSTGEGHAEQVKRAAARRAARDPAPADQWRLSRPILPEAATVYWRPRADGERLDRRGRLGRSRRSRTSCRSSLTAALLCALSWAALPVALACLAHACVIPALYAAARRERRAAAAEDHRGGGADRAGACSATWSAMTRASCTRRPGSSWSAAARHLARRRGGRAARSRPQVRALLLRAGRRTRPAERRPHRAPAARAAHRRAGLRHGREPRVRGRRGACARGCATRCARRSTARPRPSAECSDRRAVAAALGRERARMLAL